MEWTAEAKRLCETPLKQPSAQTLLFTPFCLRTKKNTAAAEVRTWEAGEWEAAGTGDTRRNRAPTEKKFLSKYPKKRADDFLKSPKNSPSIRFTPRLTKNSVISMAWATFRIKPTSPRAITRFVSP